MNQSKVNQLQPTVSTQNSNSTEETPSDAKVVTDVFDHATDATTQSTDTQKGTEEFLSIPLNMIVDANEKNDCIMMIYVAIGLLRLLILIN